MQQGRRNVGTLSGRSGEKGKVRNLASKGKTAFFSVYLLASVFTIQSVFAEDAPPPTPTPFPQTGLLSGGSKPTGSTVKQVTGPVGGISLDANAPAAQISGSVSRKENGWVGKIFNNGKGPVSVSATIIQTNESGRIVKRDSIGGSIGAGKSIERVVSAGPGSIDAQLEMSRWKGTGPAVAATATPAAKAAGHPEENE